VVGFVSKHRKEPPLTRVWKRGGSGGVRVKMPKMDHLRLAFGHEGGGGGGVHVEMPKSTTSGSHLDVREVVVGVTSKRRNQPPPACIWM